jgi:excinuclease UvrABC nuclease subunit
VYFLRRKIPADLRAEYDKVEMAAQVEREMFEAAEALDFERAAALRDQLRELKELPELIVSSRTKKDVARKTRGRRKTKP